MKNARLNMELIVNQKEIKYTQENIDDIMSMALEGGITYWCNQAKVKEKYLGTYASEQISRGGTLHLYDEEDDSEYELTLEKFITGLLLFLQENPSFITNSDLDVCQMDAADADIIIQYALFGEIVYG